MIRSSNPLAQEPRYELITRVLRENILSGTLPAGFVLLEGPIAAVMQTSRVPVREALKLLAAQGSLQQAVNASAGHSASHNLLGILARQQGNFRQAERHFQRALQAQPDYAIAHKNLAFLYELYLGEPLAAHYHYQQYYAMTQDEQAKVWLALLEQQLRPLLRRLKAATGAQIEQQKTRLTIAEDTRKRYQGLADQDYIAREELLRAYFDPVHGHAYTLCRVPMGSSDFGLGNYAHADVEGDFELQHFNIERDRQAILPLIHAAQRAAGRPIRLLASPWSPPAWMKTTGRMNEGGQLRPECRAAWAQCYVRFIQAYAAEGVPIWGVSVQNEPAATPLFWYGLASHTNGGTVWNRPAPPRNCAFWSRRRAPPCPGCA